MPEEMLEPLQFELAAGSKVPSAPKLLAVMMELGRFCGLDFDAIERDAQSIRDPLVAGGRLVPLE